MQRYLLRRFLFSLFAIWATVTLTFVFVRALPGDPITTMVGSEGDPAAIEGIKARLGLDEPVPIQYLYFLRSVAKLDFGDSIYLRLPVVDQIKTALPRSISLALISFILAVAIGIPAGIISATRRYTIWDTKKSYLHILQF